MAKGDLKVIKSRHEYHYHIRCDKRVFFLQGLAPSLCWQKSNRNLAGSSKQASRQAIICNYMYLHLPNSTMDDGIKERFIPG